MWLHYHRGGSEKKKTAHKTGWGALWEPPLAPVLFGTGLGGGGDVSQQRTPCQAHWSAPGSLTTPALQLIVNDRVAHSQATQCSPGNRL